MKVAFLDRDGVINVDHGYVGTRERFEFTPHCFSVLRFLLQQGYHIIIVTNQSGIARQYFSEADYQALSRWYTEQLNLQDILVTAIYHCPHGLDDHCECRKPKPGLFLQAQKEFPAIDFKQSLIIGDKLSDMQAALAVGISQLFLLGQLSHQERLNQRSLGNIKSIQQLADIQQHALF